MKRSEEEKKNCTRKNDQNKNIDTSRTEVKTWKKKKKKR